MKKIMMYTMCVGIFAMIFFSCKSVYFRSNYKEANTLLHDTNNLKTQLYLKAHFKNGDVCVLKDTWKIDTLANTVSGIGTHYDFNRAAIHTGDLSFSIDSVSIFETNDQLKDAESGRITALSILAGADVVLGLICLVNPKACFGSCPTFYLHENDNFHYADAEGFSNAISPSLEYEDVDALHPQRIKDGVFSLHMKNEALETHCINDLKLLAYPLQKGERVYQSPDNKFYLCDRVNPIQKAVAEEGDISSLLVLDDRKERNSYADDENLSSREEIILTFDKEPSALDMGLILHFRQTLMTTYFIYSAMGYMGNEVGDIFALLERDASTLQKLKGGIKAELGGIDIYTWDQTGQSWILQNSLSETGPIAINRQFVPLNFYQSSDDIKVKIVMNKGLWRIDYAALTHIKSEVDPLEMPPHKVIKENKEDAKALASLANSSNHLISMPGNDFEFVFSLPKENQMYELFLKSKGYYLEWMRESWIKDKDLLKLRDMIEYPKKYLKDEAKNYKLYENDMEQQFWDSKIDTRAFSVYEL